MANKIAEKILDAAEILLNSGIAKAGYDKTIKANIVAPIDGVNRSYRVAYQGGEFVAQAVDSTPYNVGDWVYVLIPANSNTNLKKILGYAAIDTKAESAGVISEYLKLGPSVLQSVISGDGEEKITPFKELLGSYYKKDNIALAETFTSGHSLYLAAEFKTNKILSATGTFGLKLTLKHKENNEQVFIILDDLHMTGNPFAQLNWTKQEIFSDLPLGKTLNEYEITSLEFFCEGFGAEEILVRNIELISILRTADSNGLHSTIRAVNGYTLNTDTLTFEARAYYNGEAQTAEQFTSYWYKEYPSATGDTYGGLGWTRIHSGSDHTLTLEDDTHCPARTTRFKLVVRAGNKQFDKIFTVTNTTSNYEIKISTDGAEKPTLTCLVEGAAENDVFAYKWFKAQGSSKVLQESATNQLAQIDLTTIVLSAEYICEVSVNNSYLGSASIELTQKSADYKVYFTPIGRVFRYDAQGMLDNDFSAQAEVAISKVIDKDDNIVDLSNSIITWSFNETDSLITGLQRDQVNGAKASYTVTNKYNINKDKNDITVTIQLPEGVVTGVYQPSFIMDGDPGSSGSDIVLVVSDEQGNRYPIVKTGDSITLKAQLYNKNELVDADVSWQIFGGSNKTTNLTINGATVRVNSNTPDVNNSHNIVQCVATYEGKKYYGVCPIITTNNPERAKALTYGFHWARYGADKLNPQYSDEKYAASSGSWTINETYFNWTSSDISTLVPKIEFPGEGHSAAIKWSDGDNWVHIPIYLYLNTFGLGFLNNWDGNSLQIDNDGSRILAATIGAGHKKDNTFTGVLMGDVYNEQKKSDTSTDVIGRESGIFGYGSGIRKFFLDAETGNAYFEGEIHATSGTFTGSILGGDIKIGGTTEQPNFYVDNNGNVQLNGNITWGANASPVKVQYSADGTNANWHDDFNVDVDKFARYSYDGGVTWTVAIKIVGDDGGSADFTYDALLQILKTSGDGIYNNNGSIGINASAIQTGQLVIGSTGFPVFSASMSSVSAAESGTVNLCGWIAKYNRFFGGDKTNGFAGILTGSGSNKIAFFAGTKTYPDYGSLPTISDCPFCVTYDGALYATKGSIGGWQIDSNESNLLSASNGTVGLYSGEKYTAAINGASASPIRFYAGANISSTNIPFIVTARGELKATSGKIANMIITNKGLQYSGDYGKNSSNIITFAPQLETYHSSQYKSEDKSFVDYLHGNTLDDFEVTDKTFLLSNSVFCLYDGKQIDQNTNNMDVDGLGQYYGIKPTIMPFIITAAGNLYSQNGYFTDSIGIKGKSNLYQNLDDVDIRIGKVQIDTNDWVTGICFYNGTKAYVLSKNGITIKDADIGTGYTTVSWLDIIFQPN